MITSLSANPLTYSPNPIVGNGVKVSGIKFGDKEVSLEVMSSQGAVIFSRKEFIPMQKESLDFSLPQLENGIYFVRLIVDNMSFTNRIVVIH
jgi:hypothetical protein